MNRTIRTAAVAGLTALATIVGAGGCAGDKPRTATIQLKPGSAPKEVYLQKFDEAYAVLRSNGETDVVLRVAGSPKPELDQVMHLRILWKPMRGTKADQPSTTNAVIDWYVTGKPDATGRPEMLHFAGAGFVTTTPSRDAVWVAIKNASLKLASRRGSLKDPVSPATLKGSFYATVNPDRVDEALAGVNSDVRPARAGMPSAPSESMK
jgi:hypothetical protein